MKRGFSWILAWLGVVCLLLSMALPASAYQPPAWNRSEQPSRELLSLFFNRILPTKSTNLIRSRGSPREYLLAFSLFLSADDVDPVGPPWLDYRGPRVGMGAAGQAVRLPVTLAAPKRGVERASSPKFLPSTGQIKNRGFCTRLELS